MFVYLSKLLPLFIYPLGLCFFILLLALLLLKKKPKWTFSLVLAALAVIFLAGNRWVSYGLARSLEWRYLPAEQMPEAEVIVVLGGGTESADYPRPGAEVNAAGDRMLYAGSLYKSGAASHLLLSGGNLDFSQARGSTPAEEMQQILHLMEIPADAIWLQDQSQNTYEDALYSAEMLHEKGITEIILVTSAMHMPRSVALFEKQGLHVIPAPTDFTITEKNWQAQMQLKPDLLLLNLIPNSSSLSLTTNVFKEYLGMTIYRLRGWMD